MTSPFLLIKQAFQLIGESPALFFKIILIPGVLSLLAAALQPAKDTAIVNPVEWSIFIFLTIAMIVANILMVIALTYAVGDRTLTAKAAYKMSKSKFWRYLGFSLLLGLITLIAFILLIVPAIIVGVWFAFGSFFLILENHSITNALKASRDLVKGRWWAVAWRLLVLIFFTLLVYAVWNGLLLALAGAAPESVINLLLALFDLIYTPFATAFMFLLYYNLKSTRNLAGIPIAATPSYQTPS